MRTRSTVVFVVVLCLVAIPALAQRIVYTGQDPSAHYPDGESIQLTQNMVMWAGGGANPNVGYVNGNDNVAGLLAAAGFTNLTEIPIADLDTTNLSVFDVVWIGRTDDNLQADLDAASANVQAYVDAGGNLVAEDQRNGYAWIPFGTAIGGTGGPPDNDTIHITDPGHPVMAGLTDNGLSGWGNSCHARFATPGAAGFITLAVDVEAADEACTVAFQGAIPSMGPIGLVSLLALLIATGLIFLGRGRLASGRIAG